MLIRHKRRPKSNCNRPGLTALELVVASALAVLLMVSVLGLLARLASQRKLIEEKTSVHAWQFNLANVVRRDLASAERVGMRLDELSVIGYGGIDTTSATATLRPTQIRYAIMTEQGASWLVREETRLDENTNFNWRRELACRGAVHIEASAYNTRLKRWEALTTKGSEQMWKWRTAPAWLRVRVFGDGPDTLLLDEIIARHGVAIQ